MVGAIVVAIDRLPAWAAPLVPVEWEAWFGERVIDSLAQEGGFCRGAAGQAALDDLARRLSAAADLEKPVRVRVINWRVVNAFAVPGGQIGVLRGLIEHAQSGDEVAGVLAHEIGHVAHRHPTVGMLRQLGVAATVQLLLGGSGTGVQDAAGFGQTLLTLSYSRGARPRPMRRRSRSSARPGSTPMASTASSRACKSWATSRRPCRACCSPIRRRRSGWPQPPGAQRRPGADAGAVAGAAGDMRIAALPFSRRPGNPL